MGKITRKELETAASTKPEVGSYIKVGMSTCGIAAGAKVVYDVFTKEVKHRDFPIEIKQA